MAGRQVGRHQHAGGYGLTMQPVAIAGPGFDGMSEGMTQVEQGAPAAFTFIVGDDFRLDRAGSFYGIGERWFVARTEPLDVLFEPDKETGVMDQSRVSSVSVSITTQPG